MNFRLPITAISFLAIGATASASVADEDRARTNWVLNCQGCHQADASGSDGGAPNMVGFVARFLEVEGGREFLVRVPGVAHAPLPDDEVAELVNWMLVEFDADHLPADFKPYAQSEVAALRADPLIDDAAVWRTRLITELERKTN